MRSGGVVRDIPKDGLAKEIGSRMKGASAFVDGSLFNEELELIKALFGDRVYSVNPVKAPLASTARIGDLDTAGTIVVFRLDLDALYGALGSLVKRRAAVNEAKVILVDAPPKTFSMIDAERITSAEFVGRAAELAGRGGCVFVYRDLTDKERAALAGAKGARLLWLPPETNTLGLARLGIDQGRVQGDTLFFFGRDFPEVAVKEGAFVACFSPYENHLTMRADLVVPVRNGFEREGTFYNLEGELVRRASILSPEPWAVDLRTMLSSIQAKG